MTVKFLFVMTNKKARTTEDSISRPFTRPIRFGLRIILMLKQLFCDRLLDSEPLSLLDVPYQILILSDI